MRTCIRVTGYKTKEGRKTVYIYLRKFIQKSLKHHKNKVSTKYVGTKYKSHFSYHYFASLAFIIIY